MASSVKPAAKAENFWLNLGFNIAAPTLMLMYGKKAFLRLGVFSESFEYSTQAVFVLALLFPICYGVYDLIKRGKWNLFSIIGVISVLLTGGIGLMELSKKWMVVKETAVPLALGVAVLCTLRTKRPLIKLLIMNDSVLDVAKIEGALAQRGTKDDFDARLKSATYLVAASFLLSAVLNFLLASYIFQSPAGTDEFNAEVGRMTALSYPVIVLPTMAIMIYAMFKIFGAVKECAGLSLEEAMAEHLRDKAK